MKILDITPITDSSEFPVKKGTLQFLQDAYKESLASTIQALIGSGYDPTVVYILSGARNSGTYPAYSITAGAAFYNGEVFLIDAAGFTATGSNVGIFQVVVTQYIIDADPVTFTDTTVRNVHNIRKLQVVQGAGGSGIANYAQAFFLSFTIPQQLVLLGTGVATVTGAYPNLFVNVPTPPTNTHPILLMGTLNVGDPSGGTGFTVTFADVGTASYMVDGSFISNGTNFAFDSAVTYAIKNRTNTSFQIFVREYANSGQNVAFEWKLTAK
jgi:hypothetical protein